MAVSVGPQESLAAVSTLDFWIMKTQKLGLLGGSSSLLFGLPLGSDLESFYCISFSGGECKIERLNEGLKLQGSRSWRDLGNDIREYSKNFIHPRRLRALREFYDFLYVFYFFGLDCCSSIMGN